MLQSSKYTSYILAGTNATVQQTHKLHSSSDKRYNPANPQVTFQQAQMLQSSKHKSYIPVVTNATIQQIHKLHSSRHKCYSPAYPQVTFQ